MSIVWYPKIWWNFCLSEIRNKTNIYCGVVKVRVGSIQYWGIETFKARILSDFFGENVQNV